MKRYYTKPTIKEIEIKESQALLLNTSEEVEEEFEINEGTRPYLSEQWVKRYKGVFGDEEW